jgi:DNA-directed RNA polymerase specialized sigma24 family protein
MLIPPADDSVARFTFMAAKERRAALSRRAYHRREATSNARPFGAAIAAGRRAATDGAAHPTATEIAVLHERVVIGHPAAVEALIERLLPILTSLVQRAFPSASEDLVVDGVEDALLEYAKAPQKFDSSRGVPLLAFLRLAAVRNLSNLVRGESRRRARERKLAEDAKSFERARPIDSADGSDDGLTDVVEAALSSSMDPAERAAVAQWLQGERRTDQLARALGIGHLPMREQQRALKRLKDRAEIGSSGFCAKRRVSR